MNPLTVGYVSLVLVLCAGVVHVRRVWQGEIVINPISWFIWFAVSFAILLSYGSMNTKHEYYVAVGNVIFPGINFLLSFRQKVKVELGAWDYGALGLGTVSIVMWWFIRQDSEKSQYANYLAIIADMCALIPTFKLVKSNPMVEKPLPWILFACGFGFSVFAIENYSFSNYVLPIYMFLGAGLIFFIQIKYRFKHKIKESWY